MKISDLKALQQQGVYTLLNEQEKAVYVGYGKNALSSLFNLLQSLKLRTKSYDTRLIELYEKDALSFSFSPFVGSLHDLKLHVNSLMVDYQQQGYTLLNKRLALSYYADVVVQSGKALVVLKRAHEAIVVGAFERLEEAEGFRRRTYGQGPVKNIVYADNEATKLYVNKYK